MFRMSSAQLGVFAVLAWMSTIHATDPTAGSTVVLTLKQGLRRLQHDEVVNKASSVHVDGSHCAMNMTHLDSLEMKVLQSSVPGCTAKQVCDDLLKHGSVEVCEVDTVVYHPTHTP